MVELNPYTPGSQFSVCIKHTNQICTYVIFRTVKKRFCHIDRRRRRRRSPFVNWDLRFLARFMYLGETV